MGLTLRPRESLYATTIWLGLSGLLAVNVSDWVTFGEISAPVTRSTSVVPKARGVNSALNKPRKATRRGSRASLCLAAVNHDRAGPHVFLLIDAQLVDLGTIKHDRHKGISGLTMIIRWFCWACAENAPKPSSAINTLTRQKTEASKMTEVKEGGL